MSGSGLGNFTKAVGKGMGGPCFRIIQTHFASQNNVGDVSAKEQVSSGFAQKPSSIIIIINVSIVDITIISRPTLHHKNMLETYRPSNR